MPISIPPISRRRFLATLAVTAGAYIVPSRWAFAADDEAAHRFALLSDIHIAANPGSINFGHNMTANLKQVCTEILQREHRPGTVLMNGDCTLWDGQPEDYSAVLGLFKPLTDAGMPIHLTLGNHDHRENFWKIVTDEAKRPRPVPDRQIAIVESPRADWFILDSLDVTCQTPGKLGKAQLDWLTNTLDQRKVKPVIVMVHHPPDPLPWPRGLIDTLDLFKIISPRRQVKALIFGHTHDWHFTQRDDGIHLINLPACGYPFNPNKAIGWVDTILTEKGASFELRCIDPKHSLQGQKLNATWRT